MALRTGDPQDISAPSENDPALRIRNNDASSVEIIELCDHDGTNPVYIDAVAGDFTVKTNATLRMTIAKAGTVTFAPAVVVTGALSANGGLVLADAKDVTIDATTGSKIGQATSKIGFYGAAPILQAVLATGAAHTVDDVITALQNLGLVKQA